MEPNIYVMDNEASTYIKNADIKYQLILQRNCQTNRSEIAIHIFKAHLKAELTSLDLDFPILNGTG